MFYFEFFGLKNLTFLFAFGYIGIWNLRFIYLLTFNEILEGDPSLSDSGGLLLITSLALILIAIIFVILIQIFIL